MTVPVSEIQAIAPSAIIELFELQLDATIHGVTTLYRFHAGVDLTGSNGDVVWAGNTYTKFPVEASEFEYSGTGQLPRPKIRVSNILGTITAIILVTPLEGAKVTRIRTMAKYLDAVNFPGGVNPTADPTSEWPREVYYIDRKSAETRDVVEYEMCAAFDLVGVRAPKRQCINNICQWVYRSAECSYTGIDYYDENDESVASSGLDVCGKRLSSCQARFNSFSRSGTVTISGNTLNLVTATSVSTGTLVAGFGVPTSTTVLSSSGSTVTLSNAATATTSVTTTGTLQANLTQIIVTSSSGLAIGMSVTGPYISAGTTVSAISGTTITLTQPATGTTVYTAAGTRSAKTPSAWFDSSLMIFQSGTTTGLAVGMRVMGQGLPTDYSTQITQFISSTQINTSYSRSASAVAFGYTFYTVSTVISSGTYTFSGSNNYIFRDSSAALPFGSFPGVGTYFT